MRQQIEARMATFAQRVCEIYQAVSARPGGRRAAEQLLDAATSASANYRAAGRARSTQEFVAKLGVANEEADEAVHWLEFIARTPLGESLDIKALRTEASELRAIIARSYATARRNRRKRAERNLPERRSRERE